MGTTETFSPAEIRAVTGAPVTSVYKLIGDRLPGGLPAQRDRQQYLTRWGAVCFVIDREMPKDVPVSVRRQIYASIMRRQAALRVRCDRGILSYVVNVKAVADRVDQDLTRYRGAMRLIVEDNAIQGGAATFSGTRILVHRIAAMMAEGTEEAELLDNHPRLTRAMIAAAVIYARVHPRRGRPRKPARQRADRDASKQ